MANAGSGGLSAIWRACIADTSGGIWHPSPKTTCRFSINLDALLTKAHRVPALLANESLLPGMKDHGEELVTSYAIGTPQNNVIHFQHSEPLASFFVRSSTPHGCSVGSVTRLEPDSIVLWQTFFAGVTVLFLQALEGNKHRSVAQHSFVIGAQMHRTVDLVLVEINESLDFRLV